MLAILANLVIGDGMFDNAFVQHFPIPILQTLWLGYLLLGRMNVEYVVISLARRTGPNVCHRVSKLLAVLQISQ